MPRLEALDPRSTDGKLKKTFDAIESNIGIIPNFFRTLAHSPAVLEAYLGFSQALSSGVIPPKERELIILAVSEANKCHYCLAAHTAISQKMGISNDEIIRAREGRSDNPRLDAILKFSISIVENQGWIDDHSVETIKKKGISQAEIAEIVANVSLTLFTNYFNHVAQPDVDFPEISKLPKRL